VNVSRRDLKVVHVAQPVDGGVARYVIDLARAQRDAGSSPAIVSPRGWLAAQAAKLGLPWQQWDSTRSPGPAVAGEVRRLRRLLRELEPDVVHLHSSKAGLAGRLALRERAPTMFSPHGWAWQAVTGPVAAAAAGWERVAMRWTSALVCVSEAELTAGRAHGVRMPLADDAARGAHVVRTGADLTVFAPADRAEARQRLNLPTQGPLAVCVGRLDEQKGQELLVRAWPTVRKDAPTAALALVGSGSSRGKLETLVAELGVEDHVLFAGEVAEVAAWYAAADVVAFSSRWGEALPLTPLEAMASGRSLVATDVAGIRETLAPGCGAIVAPSAAELATALVERLADPALAGREGAAARRWAEDHHDARTAHDALLAICRDLAG
jgi:glycosyltransferase involved in cell wall biosynthesis